MRPNHNPIMQRPLVVVSAPRFRREPGDTHTRLGVVEDYLARKEEHDRQRDEAVAAGIRDLDNRLTKLEGWKVDVLIFIGATKIRWSVVMFVASIAASVFTAAAIKILHL